jgi:hypothetical protein
MLGFALALVRNLTLDIGSASVLDLNLASDLDRKRAIERDRVLASVISASVSDRERASALEQALERALERDRALVNVLASAIDRNLASAIDRKRASTFALERALASALASAIAFALDRDLAFLARKRAPARERGLASGFALERALARARDLASDLAHARARGLASLFVGIDFARFSNQLEVLRTAVPKEGDPLNEFLRFTDLLLQLYCETFKLSPALLALHPDAIKTYLYMNRLMVQCQQEAIRVTPKVWEEILDTMLVPAKVP